MWSKHLAVVAIDRWPSCLEIMPISTPWVLSSPTAHIWRVV